MAGTAQARPTSVVPPLLCQDACLTWCLPAHTRAPCPQASVCCMEAGWEAHLRGMLRYGAAHTCRRALLARHFAEPPPPCNAMCDVCARAAGAAPGAPAAPAAAAAAGAAGAGAAGAAAAAAAAGDGAALKDVTEACKGAVQTLQAWPGSEKRATLIQLLDKWRASKVGG